jgi:16S rRNA G527 N7-methylase RsmG
MSFSTTDVMATRKRISYLREYTTRFCFKDHLVSKRVEKHKQKAGSEEGRNETESRNVS